MENIIFDNNNKSLLNNIITTGKFPNLLLYGPPGTGKTTTIINLVKEYQTKYSVYNSEKIIHLNASDERGVDIIRNQIHTFINSTSLFHKGIKFIILDEIDYMTKLAQQSLKYLLQQYITHDVCFCLICNYISRIDECLLNEIMCIRFNQLPQNDVINLIQDICINENITISNEKIKNIYIQNNSDIRSILNYLQINQYSLDELTDETLFITDSFNILTIMIQDKDNIDLIYKYIMSLCTKHNIQITNIINKYFNYIIKQNNKYITPDFLNVIENIVHNEPNCDYKPYIYHIITQLYDLL
jgi:replication factor C subunit 3/5